MMRRGLSTTGLIATVVLVIGAGLWFLFVGDSQGNGSRVFAGELYEVTEGSFEITVPTSGELAAEKQINIYNHLESGATIIELGAVIFQDVL